MFYSQVILARKGPLGKIWLAAHFDKKLTKTQIFSTDITDSVETVLNPTTPLALRVSGHLMLGIVRIYSRKVKYLMSDATEAMWKIKLAFRPGNVDIDQNAGINLNIDDNKFFGNTSLENEFPYVDGTGFLQNQITGNRDLRSQQSSEVSNRYSNNGSSYLHSLDGGIHENYDSITDLLTAQSPLDARLSQRGVDRHSSSKNSRVSDIELMRDERSFSGARSGLLRSSLSSLHTGRQSGLSMTMSFEDDIPVFDDRNMYDNSSFQVDQDMNAITGFHEDNRASSMGNMKLLDLDNHVGEIQQTIDDMHLVPPADETMIQSVEEVEGDQSRPVRSNKAIKRVVKKRAIPLDNRVELPNRLIKQRMNDSGVIIRCDPAHDLHDPELLHPFTHIRSIKDRVELQLISHQAKDRRCVSMPVSIRGFCPRLRSTFESTKDLPQASTRTTVSTVDRSGVTPEVPLTISDRQSVGPIEITRTARNSDVIGARRHSSMDPSAENTFEPFYADESDGGILSRYSDASRSGMDLGYVDDNSAMFPSLDGEGVVAHEPLMAFEASPVAANDDREAAEERKSSSVDAFPQHVTRQQSNNRIASNRTATAKTLISELVSDAFRVNFDSHPQNTQQLDNLEMNRTNVFHSLLLNEFSTKPTVTFDELSAGVSKRVAACCFLEVLQLKTWGRIDVAQSTPFGDISLTQVSAMQ